jgi:3-hydroxyisobutyrate dehydrogenase-like beta-hydroxyacid dehydrogenase
LLQALAERAESAGIQFADVAIMAPVPGRGLDVPMLVSGRGANQTRDLLTPLGAQITVQPGAAGEAARRKLLRSTFYKGLAAAVVEALEAARAAGCEDWLTDNIGEELDRADRATIDRLVQGSWLHADRRITEMEAAVQMEEEFGLSPHVAIAARDVLKRLSAQRTMGTAG